MKIILQRVSGISLGLEYHQETKETALSSTNGPSGIILFVKDECDHRTIKKIPKLRILNGWTQCLQESDSIVVVAGKDTVVFIEECLREAGFTGRVCAALPGTALKFTNAGPCTFIL